jgi:D-hydroxyproline dehydrogenase subunit beta
VVFSRNNAVHAVEPPDIHTSLGRVQATCVAVCPGDDFTGLYAEHLTKYSLRRCKLQMMRLADPGWRLPAALMSDLGLGRYHGYADLPMAAPLKARLANEQASHLEHGVHLIVVQGADGTLVVGDSHHYAPTPDPFSLQAVDELILEEFRSSLGVEPPPVIERWTGTYASASDRPMLIDAPEPSVRVAIVTCGAGASTGFAIGEELITSLLDTGVTA